MTRVFLASDMTNQYRVRMQKEEGRNDPRQRATTFALRIIRLFAASPKTAPAQRHDKAD
jgi:hypothetical protein